MLNLLFSLLVLCVATGFLGGCSSDKPEDQKAEVPTTDSQIQAETEEEVEPDTPAETAGNEDPQENDLASTPPEPVAEPPHSEPDETAETPEESPGNDSDPSTEPPAPELPEPAPDEADDGSAPNVVVPPGPVRVAAKEGLTYIGTERCAKCHKVQHASWLESPHATLTDPLDCEGCHGPGSAYKSIKIMKDPEASRAAGLVDPSPEFCAKCHVAGWEDDMLQRAHAHKPPASD